MSFNRCELWSALIAQICYRLTTTDLMWILMLIVTLGPEKPRRRVISPTIRLILHNCYFVRDISFTAASNNDFWAMALEMIVIIIGWHYTWLWIVATRLIVIDLKCSTTSATWITSSYWLVMLNAFIIKQIAKLLIELLIMIFWLFKSGVLWGRGNWINILMVVAIHWYREFAYILIRLSIIERKNLFMLSLRVITYWCLILTWCIRFLLLCLCWLFLTIWLVKIIRECKVPFLIFISLYTWIFQYPWI